VLELEILSIAILVCCAAVLPGVFLVLRGVSLMSDAISHAVLLGIAIMFFLVQRLDSPLLLLGAGITGLLTVWCTESIIKTGCLKKDAAIGIVFPLFFSVGVILISLFARNVHLDADMVLLGEIAFAAFNRFIFFGHDLGPCALWTMGTIFLLNLTFVWLFYKELKLITFDTEYAIVLGYSPTLLYYGLMSITSITAVSAFDIVGSIVLVALMITPPVTAYLLTNKLFNMIVLSVGIAIASALSGYACSWWADVSIAGSIATAAGVIFLLVLCFSSQKGIWGQYIARKRKREKLAGRIVLEYLKKSGGSQAMLIEAIALALNWNKKDTQQAIYELHYAQKVLVVGEKVCLL